MKKGISVIICTYNGANKLSQTLKHLSKQKNVDQIRWEVILVDNASSDNSISIAKQEWSSYNCSTPFYVYQEQKPGKLFAFQKGITLAKYEYFVICDDDNWLDPNYLSTAYSILEADLKIGATGGQTYAVTDNGVHLPDWFKEYEKGYAVGKQMKNTGNITWRGHLWGAGLTSRTQLYKDAYKKIPSLLINPIDRKILSAEDTEYCLRLILNGYTLYYDSRLKLKHFIPKDRLTVTYRDELYQNFKNAHDILEKYYLAIKFGKNSKLTSLNKLRLSLITPLRFIFSKTSKNKQKTILAYLYPKVVKADRFSAQIDKLYEKR